MWSLAAIAIVSGVAMLWVFRRFSDQAGVALAKRQLRAHLYAFRLYAGEPWLIFRAQKQLLIWNGRYLGLMLRPTAVILVPALLLMAGLDTVYGHRALMPGESTIVTAQFGSGTDVRNLAPALTGKHVAVETPPVRIPGEHQVCWRVRATGATGGVILSVSGVTFVKNMQSHRFPSEGLLHSGPLKWIEVSHPAAQVSVLGFGMHWLIWFIVVNLATVLVLGKFLGIRF